MRWQMGRQSGNVEDLRGFSGMMRGGMKMGCGTVVLVILISLFSVVLPCADCEGIRYTLNLQPGNLFYLRQTYLGKGAGEGQSFYERTPTKKNARGNDRAQQTTPRRIPVALAPLFAAVVGAAAAVAAFMFWLRPQNGTKSPSVADATSPAAAMAPRPSPHSKN